jgi:hypothetical protein
VQREFERFVMWLRPDGWQARARRNAWAAMVVDHQRRHERSLVDREGTRLGAAKSSLQAQVQ